MTRTTCGAQAGTRAPHAVLKREHACHTRRSSGNDAYPTRGAQAGTTRTPHAALKRERHEQVLGRLGSAGGRDRRTLYVEVVTINVLALQSVRSPLSAKYTPIPNQKYIQKWHDAFETMVRWENLLDRSSSSRLCFLVLK